ncbi:hypothetical protein ACKLNR_003148 [Fusarium oxysporum f. sp. zingiberi]
MSRLPEALRDEHTHFQTELTQIIYSIPFSLFLTHKAVLPEDPCLPQGSCDNITIVASDHVNELLNYWFAYIEANLMLGAGR